MLGVECGDQADVLALFLTDVAAVGLLGSRILLQVGGDVRSPAAPGALVVRTVRGFVRGGALRLLGAAACGVAFGPTFPPFLGLFAILVGDPLDIRGGGGVALVLCTARSDDCVT